MLFILFFSLSNDYRWRIFRKFEKRNIKIMIPKPFLFIILTGPPEYRYCLVLNSSVKCSGYALKILKWTEKCCFVYASDRQTRRSDQTVFRISNKLIKSHRMMYKIMDNWNKLENKVKISSNLKTSKISLGLNWMTMMNVLCKDAGVVILVLEGQLEQWSCNVPCFARYLFNL